MTRIRLPNRRANETRKIKVTFENGKEQKVLITIGFDDDGEPREVFCADFKAGTTMQTVVMDACILISRVLQHGDSAADLIGSMCRGPSLIGAIIAEVAKSRGPGRNGAAVPDAPDAPRPSPTATAMQPEMELWG